MGDRLTSLRRLSTSTDRLSRPSTGYDPVLNQYVREEDQKAKKRKIQPLRLLFDILSRPQYVTANIAEEITRSIQTGEPIGQAAADAIKGAWQGVTGQRKGDWENILFGGNAEGSTEKEQFSGWFPGAGEQLSHPLIKLKPGANGEERGILRPKKMIGLAANIVMDPTTWIGVGPAKAARSSAKQFAEDAVALAAKDPDLALKVIGQIDASKVKALKQLAQKLSGKDASRYMNEVYTAAYKTALKTPAKELVEKSRSVLADLAPKVSIGEEVTGTMMKAPGGIEDIMAKLSQPDVYGGAGKRATRIFGKELQAEVRQPNVVERSFETVRDAFDRTKVGGAFKDAWWAVMNKGPVGEIRKLFGIRNPYQTILNQKKRQVELGFHATQQQEFQKLHQMVGKVSDDDLNVVRDIFDAAYVAEGARRTELKATKAVAGTEPMQRLLEEPISYVDILANPKAYNINPEDAKRLEEVVRQVDTLKTQWKKAEDGFVETGALNEFGDIANYVPVHTRGSESMYYTGSAMGTKAPGFTKRKSRSFSGAAEDATKATDLIYGDLLQRAMETAKSGSEFYGKDYATVLKEFTEKHKFSNIATDFREMLMHRATAHARAKKRTDMVEAFREFGVPTAELAGDARMNAVLYNLEKAGLHSVSDPAFAGYVFDKDVAQIVDKVYAASANEATQNGLKLAFRRMTQWWKSMVTLTPGFHVRNWMSNQMTGYIKSGTEWFDPKWAPSTIAGTAYAMNPGKYEDILSQTMKASPGWVKRELSKRVGDKSIQELAEEAVERGVISHSTKGFDLPEDILSLGDKAKKAVGQNNIVFRSSRKIGDVVESSSKFQSFLIDYSRAVQGGSSSDEALRFAAEETKKWFIDYGDLTDFEKNVMRNVVPFYGWIRKNISNQLTGILMYPDAYNLVGKVMESGRNDEDFDYSIVPQYFEEQGMYPVTTDPETGYPVMFRPDFPFKDINMIPLTWEEGSILPTLGWRQATDDVMQAAHPIIKTIMALAPDKGWNFFRRSDIRKQETAPAVFQYFTKSPQVLGFLDGLLRMAGFEEGVKADMSRDNNRVVMDGKAVQIMENHMPALRLVGNLLQDTETVTKFLSGRGDLIEDMIENVSGKRDYYEGLEALLQTLARLGVKFKTLNTDYYAPVAGQKILDKARERKRSDEYNAITAKTRSAAQQRSKNATLRKYGLL